MTIDEILAGLAEINPAEFAKALQSGQQTHYQEIFNQGHSAATHSAKGKREELEGQLRALAEQLQAKDVEAGELRKKQPDLDAWKEEKEQALLQKEEEWRSRYEDLEGRLKQEATDGFRRDLVQQLRDLHVDPWAAERAVDDQVMRRVQADLDGGVKVYQADGQTPFAPGEGQSSAALLARELVSGIPEAFRQPPRQAYGGSHTRSRSEPARSFSEQEIARMSPEEYAANREAIREAQTHGQIT